MVPPTHLSPEATPESSYTFRAKPRIYSRRHWPRPLREVAVVVLALFPSNLGQCLISRSWYLGSKRIYTDSKHSHGLLADTFAGKNGINSLLRKPGRSHQLSNSDLCPFFPFRTVGHRKFS
jgi:hypothetical protein